MVVVVLWCIRIGSPAQDSNEGDEGDALGPSLPWYAESPHWVVGQEFSAVQGAPFIGSTECLYCHPDRKAGYLKTAHARTLIADDTALEQQGCEACHGAGGAHAVLRSRGAIFAFDWQEPMYTSTICLRCHTWLTTREEWRHVPHARGGLKCTTCHDPHVPADHEQRFMLRQNEEQLCLSCHDAVGHEFSRFSSHPVQIEASLSPGPRAIHCTDCHDVHSGQGRGMLAEARVQDLCLRCHMEKGGPFRFVHMATEEGIGEGCLTCHKPHGSDSPWLGVADGRDMCITCHTDREQHNPGVTCWTAGCHSMIHGSNASPLFFK